MKLFVLLCCLSIHGNAFVQPTAARKVFTDGMKGADVAPLNKSSQLLPLPPLRMANRDNNDKEVNVNLIGDVDSFTLTAVGFGLIAFNFFVLANVSKRKHPSFSCFVHLIIPLNVIKHCSLNRWETRG